MVKLEQHIGLDKLRLNCRRAHRHDRLARKHRSSLGNSPDVALEFEVFEVVQKFLGEHISAAQIFYVLGLEMQVLNVVNDLLKTCADGKAAHVGILAVKHIKIGDFILHVVVEISVAHRQLVIIAQHGQIKAASVVHSYLRRCCN